MIQFVKLDRNYIQSVYNNIDKEIMINHTETGVEKDRLNALLVRMKYKDKNREFVVPLSHAIKTDKNHSQTYFPLDNFDTKNRRVGGLFFKKCLPVNKNVYEVVKIRKPHYISLAKLINAKEKEIINSFKIYLSEYVSKQNAGKTFNFSTDIDKILQFLDENYGGYCSLSATH